MKDECKQVYPLLAGYALEALDPDEQRLVDAHLASCEACQAVLEDYQQISDGLVETAVPVPPPARLRARVLGAAASSFEPRRWHGIRNIFLSQRAAVVGAAVILLLAVVNITMLVNTQKMMQDYQALNQQFEASQTALALLAYPESQISVIDDASYYGTLVYDPQGQVAVLNIWGLAPLPEGQDYQVWLIEPDQTRISGGVFQVGDAQAYTTFIIQSPTPIGGFTGIGITIEPDGGSPGPTGPRVFGTKLSG